MPDDAVQQVLDAIPTHDWDRWRVPAGPVDDARMLAPDDAPTPTEVPDAGCCGHDADPVEDGEQLRELTDVGDVDEGGFGDGAYVPDHWWEV